MAKKVRYWAGRNFGYADIPQMDVGQVTELKNQPNDEKMVRLGLLRPVEGDTVQCGRCGAEFIDAGYLNRHGKARHDKIAEEPGNDELSRLRAVEMQDEFAEKHIPLNLDKTKASLAAGL